MAIQTYGLNYPTYQQLYGYPGNSYGQSYPYYGLGMPQSRQQGGGLSGAGQQIGLGLMPYNPLVG